MTRDWYKKHPNYNHNYYIKNKIRILKMCKLYKQKNREKYREYDKNYYASHRVHILKNVKKYNTNHKKNKHNYDKKYKLTHVSERENNKIIVLQVYSNGKMCCNYCGYRENTDALSIDHINNDGWSHRKIIKKSGNSFYYWLIANNFPTNFQVLCFNCQMIKCFANRRKIVEV